MANNYATKQVIVMRKDLNMRLGKMVAQACHASLGVFTQRMKISTKMGGFIGAITLLADMVEWLNGSFAKVCVRADSEEELVGLYEKALAAGLPCIMITDNGTTEFHGVPTKTCIAIGPAKSEEIDKITGNQKLL